SRCCSCAGATAPSRAAPETSSEPLWTPMDSAGIASGAMRLYRHYEGIPAADRGAVVAIGSFDGVHRGHQAVIGKARRLAQEFEAPAGVVTFEPHPRRVLQPDLPPFLLTSFRV